MKKTIYLTGIALTKVSIGLGPVVYFEIRNGKIICNGVIGIASIAKRSFGTPASSNFNPVAESAANPILQKLQKFN